MKSIDFNGSPKIEILSLTTVLGESFDLTPLLVSMNIYEDIFSPVMTGTITINDTLGLFDRLPICGEEKITVKIYNWDYSQTNNDALNFIHRTFDILKISDISQTNEYTKAYTLHFASPELLKNETMQLSKSYINVRTSEVIARIMTNSYEDGEGIGFEGQDYFDDRYKVSPYLQRNETESWKAIKDDSNSVELFVEKTKYVEPIISFPYSKPFDIISMLASRSMRVSLGNAQNQKQAQAANFLFFENKRGFQFVSVDTLLEGKDFEIPTLQFGNAIQNSSSTSGRDFVANAIEELEIQNCFDILKSVRMGTYASTLMSYSLSTGEINVNDYNYLTEFENTESLERASAADGTCVAKKDFPLIKHDDTRLTDKYNSKRMLGAFNPVRGIDPFTSETSQRMSLKTKDVQGFEEYLQYRISQISRLSNVRVLVALPGNSQHKAGDVINLDLKNMIQSDTSKTGFDEVKSKYYSGRYLICSVRHYFTKSDYKMNLELAKDSFSAKIGE